MGPLRSLLRWLVPGGSVTERTVKSGIWVALINASSRLLQLGMLVVLARLLDPADFGLMGIALVVLAALRRFSRLGIDSALIQAEAEDVDEYLDTAWSMQVGRGLAIAAVAYLAAPAIGVLFDQPRAVPIVRVIALAPLIRGFRNPGIVYLKKHLEFHKRFVYTVGGMLVRVTASIGYALFVHRSVWALAVGYVAGSVARLGISYLVHGYRPRPAFDRAFAGELFDYGKWILGSGMVGFFYGYGDDAFVGWFLGASALGFYQLAYQLSNAPATEIAHTVTRVVFPAYSKVQDDVSNLRKGFFDTVQFTTFVSFPAGVGLIAVAPLFVEVFLGTRWLPMVLPMQVLTVYGILRAFRSPTTSLFKAVGRPDLATKIQVAKLAIVLALIYPATARWGLLGAAAVIAGNALLVNPVASYLAVRTVEARLVDLLRLLVYPAAGSLVMGAGVVGLATWLDLASPVLEFAVLVAAGVSLYALAMATIEHRFDYGIEGLFRTIRESLA